jgi:hypothetical protein
MPLIGGGDGNQMLAMAFQMIRDAQERRARQGMAQVNTALPGQTVGAIGMDPKVFAELFGKGTPYNKDRVLRLETPTDTTNQLTENYLKSLTPAQQLDIVATKMQNDSGVAGPTTMAGLGASRKTAEIKAQAGQVSAQSVAQMIDEGVTAMTKAPAAVRSRIGQQAAYGTSSDAQELEASQMQLKQAALKEAIGAISNPNAPIHKFLGDMGLNLPTVLAATAVGAENLLTTWGQIMFSNHEGRRTMEEELRKAEIDTAKKLSLDTFGGKLNPRQVLAVMDANSQGKAPPKGLEGAADVYNRSVSAAYNSALQKALTENDPFVKAGMAQIDALTKPGVDPHTLAAVADISSRLAGYSVTKFSLGPMPADPAGQAKWERVMQYNTERVPKGAIHFPAPSIHSDADPSGIGTGTPNTPLTPGMAPQGPVTPVRPISGVAPAGQIPAGLLTNQQGQDVSKAPAPLSQDQTAAISQWLQWYQQQGAAAPQAGAAAPGP